jgi:hypothetical protein
VAIDRRPLPARLVEGCCSADRRAFVAPSGDRYNTRSTTIHQYGEGQKAIAPLGVTSQGSHPDSQKAGRGGIREDAPKAVASGWLWVQEPAAKRVKTKTRSTSYASSLNSNPNTCGRPAASPSRFPLSRRDAPSDCTSRNALLRRLQREALPARTFISPRFTLRDLTLGERRPARRSLRHASTKSTTLSRTKSARLKSTGRYSQPCA